MPPLPVPRKPRRVSKAVRLLREAPSSPCPSCGRTTKTTTDGICADCWARKDGRRYGRPTELPRWLARLLRLGPRR